MFSESQKAAHFCKVFWAHQINSLAYKSQDGFPNRGLTGLSFLADIQKQTTAIYKHYHAVSWIIFQIQSCPKNRWKEAFVFVGNMLFHTNYVLLVTLSPQKDKGFSRKGQCSSLLLEEQLILILRKRSVTYSVSFWCIIIITEWLKLHCLIADWFVCSDNSREKE